MEIQARRRFLRLVGMTSATAALRRPAGAFGIKQQVIGNGQPYDDGTQNIPGGLAGDPERVIVIGAGFAGLAVANALASAGVECVVLEGRDRLGGRAWTRDVGGAPIDLGCSWITDPIGNPMTRFALQSGVLQTNAAIELDVPSSRFYDERTGVVLLPDTADAVLHALRFSDVESSDISNALGPLASTKDGILYYADEQGLSGDPRRYAEYFMRLLTELPDATDWEKDSLLYWANYQSPYVGVGQGNFPRGGYVRLVESLGGDADVRFSHRVTEIKQDVGTVCVQAEDACGKPVEFTGSHVVVTVPLGVLKARSITFSPELPMNRLDAIDRLGFGTFEKIVLRFPEPYWAAEHTHVFFLSYPTPMHFPLIVDYFHLEQVPVLVAFNVGSYGRELAMLSDAEVKDRMLTVLRTVHGESIPEPTDVVRTRWQHDPFAQGAYSYIPVGSSPADQTQIAEPLDGRILFAGEATSTTRFGYADGALSTGIREAKRLLRQPSVELRATRSLLSATLR